MGKRDPGLDNLLAMETQHLVIQDEPPWWVKIEVREVDPCDAIPHGIRYSLTLHDHHNHRVFGMDNAHAPPKPKRKRYAARRLEWDHTHQNQNDKGTVYEFDSAEQLLIDFWDGVNATLKAYGYNPI